MNNEPIIPPLVLIRVPRQKCGELHTLTINGIRAVVIGEPKTGMNYARLAKTQALSHKGPYGPALVLTQDITQFTNKDPLIVSYKKIRNLEAYLQLIGYKLEDMPRISYEGN